MCINRPGGRCKAGVVFDAVLGLITCTVNPKHTREAQDPPFEKIGVLSEEMLRRLLQIFRMNERMVTTPTRVV